MVTAARRALGLLLVAACIPGRHPVEGAACDATHPCPDGLFCVADVCSSSAAVDGGVDGGSVGPCMNPSLITDGDFETSPTAVGAYWAFDNAALVAQGNTVRSGAFAAKLTAVAGGPTVLHSQLGIARPVAGRDHCVDAYVRADRAGGPITLQLARHLGTVEVSSTPSGASVSPDGGWQLLTNRFAYPPGFGGMTIVVTAGLDAGELLFVDDVCLRVCP